MERIAAKYPIRNEFVWLVRGGRSAPGDLFTVAGACQELSVSEAAMYRLIKAGRIKSVKIGNRRLIRRDKLETYLMRYPALDYLTRRPGT